MWEWGAAVGLAVLIYAATNLDDLLLLVGFFSDPSQDPAKVVQGQFIGIGLLYIMSVLAARATILIPTPYVGLIGVAPIAMGIMRLRDHWGGGLEVARPDIASAGSRSAPAVTLVVLASGGDNIATYTPAFAVHSAGQIAVMGAVFGIMTAAWCGTARWLVVHSQLGTLFRRFGCRVLPYVLIGLGIIVLAKGNAAALIPL